MNSGLGTHLARQLCSINEVLSEHSPAHPVTSVQGYSVLQWQHRAAGLEVMQPAKPGITMIGIVESVLTPAVQFPSLLDWETEAQRGALRTIAQAYAGRGRARTQATGLPPVMGDEATSRSSGTGLSSRKSLCP